MNEPAETKAGPRMVKECKHDTRTINGWAVLCTGCGEIMNWEPHTNSTTFVHEPAAPVSPEPIVDPYERVFGLKRESQSVSASTEPPQEQSSDDGWDDYWASLDRDSQDKMRPHIDGIRAWFTIGMVWGKGGRIRELSAARYKWQAAWQQASWERNKAQRELSELRAAQSLSAQTPEHLRCVHKRLLSVHCTECFRGTNQREMDAGALYAQTPPDVELISARVHEQWMESKRAQGVHSRKSESGEELMVPYDQLSEAAKELDRGALRAVLSAMAAGSAQTGKAKDKR